ncbi:hypothetical protein SEA_BAXTERFOX_67 [Gordonia phage BaxterFox]|uniref:Uncharacterized protein n=1 Tax=Gordonia phage BaxterFox TaxID=1821549 RepID=A0A142KCP4_9CAUD|nr:hypothetical protein SEA_BAXTERFOX_67 [Gordonia phage BaxterFox]AMS03877.1 hypothetical protein SEA_BAXTERFOX_67 [Gordonia phage BaxterFox]
MAFTEHELIPALPGDVETRRECVADDHPPETFNPWQFRTYCRCGRRQYLGDRSPLRVAVDAEWTAVADDYELRAREREGGPLALFEVIAR